MARRIIQFNILAITALIATFFLGERVVAVETYSTKHNILANIAFQYAALGKTEPAVKILNQVLPLAQANPNECFKANPLVKVAVGYILVGQEAKGKQLLAQAIQIADTQTAKRCSGSATSPDESVLNRAKEYAKAGYYDFAHQIITGVNNPVFTPIALAELAGYYAKAGETEEATKVLKGAITIAQRNDNALYRTMTLIAIAEHLTQAGQKEQVPQVLEHALESASAIDEAQSDKNASMKVYQMLRIAKQFAQVGQVSRALKLLDQSLPLIRTLPDKPFPIEKASQLVETAIQYAALEQKNKALETLAEARTTAQAIAIDEAWSKYNALARVAGGYAQIGNFDQAQQIAQLIKNVNEREQAFRGIAIAYAKAGYVDQAVQLAKSIKNQNGTFMEIARHYLKIKQYDQALQLVQKWSVKGIMPEIALGYLEAGQPERALQIVESIPPPPDAKHHMEWILPAITRGFAKQGQFDQAFQVTQTMTDKNYKAQALIVIAEEYVARERENKGFIGNIFCELTNRCNSLFGSSNKDKAVEILDQALQIAQSMAPVRCNE
ncbi:hypothetical protein [Brasilonema sp. UFV-L1]|uniref:tetratricopeptide repeat protein n=1 Tax=Brasilonema sp. UFV-L1 TaxID=2234130 RepID=UPI00145E06EF|nr:hypothetical protein [Brasilonema sp. UFV-L1]NMG09408.1 hypothetical protein [Brasilonema sp. UFV-L1]